MNGMVREHLGKKALISKRQSVGFHQVQTMLILIYFAHKVIQSENAVVIAHLDFSKGFNRGFPI